MARPPWWTSSTRSTGRRARCTAPSNPDPNPIPSSNPNRNPSPDPSPDPNPDPHKVLNATGSLQNVLKQGLRDQEGMLLESDADEQVTNCLTDPDPDPDPNPSPSPSPSLDPDPNPSRPEPYCSSNHTPARSCRQLLITIAFKTLVKIESLQLTAPGDGVQLSSLKPADCAAHH